MLFLPTETTASRGRAAAKNSAVVEVLLATDTVRAIVRDGRTHQLRNAMLTGRQAGMQTLEGHLSELVSRGEVAAEDAVA